MYKVVRALDAERRGPVGQESSQTVWSGKWHWQWALEAELCSSHLPLLLGPLLPSWNKQEGRCYRKARRHWSIVKTSTEWAELCRGERDWRGSQGQEGEVHLNPPNTERSGPPSRPTPHTHRYSFPSLFRLKGLFYSSNVWLLFKVFVKSNDFQHNTSSLCNIWNTEKSQKKNARAPVVSQSRKPPINILVYLLQAFLMQTYRYIHLIFT